VIARVAAIDEPHAVRPYGRDVIWRIRQGDVDSYRRAATALNRSKVDVVNVQHEFGLYGVWTEDESGSTYTDHLRPFLEELRKPVVTTLHSVPPAPSPSMRAAIGSIAELSDEVVVMAKGAVRILSEDYGIQTPPTVIPHGMPVIEPTGRLRFKRKLGIEGRTVVSTFGLVDPRKGLEYMIQAIPAVVEVHPQVLYLIAGQTHPELLRKEGERYRGLLLDMVRKLGLSNHVSFLDEYMRQDDIIELLLASDVYVTPYLDPLQITSGTLAYALGAGKAIVSTPYLHAQEALAAGRGILVGFRDAPALAAGVNAVLSNPKQKQRLEHMAYAYARHMTWPRAGERWVRLMRRLGTAPARAPARVKAIGAAHEGASPQRLRENPILTSADVPPSDPRLEVVSVFNPAAARVHGEVVLLLRVAERPRQLEHVPKEARMLDLSTPAISLRPLPGGTLGSALVGVTFLDTSTSPSTTTVAYLERDLPGLDLSDPRTIRYHSVNGGRGEAGDIRDYLTQMSHLRVARSSDGVHFTVDDKPAVSPENHFEAYGCEDPRATLIDGVWHITYVSAGELGITTSRVTTTDFRTFERQGVMFLPDHKDVALFPEKIGGRYAALTRPMPQTFGRVLGIWIAFSDDLVNWGGHVPLALPRWGHWDEARTGASAVPFRVREGWLELYHGVDRNSRYAMGGLLLDGDDPTRVLARSHRPILVPTEEYERTGLFNDAVFSCGHVPLDDTGDRIRLYYGAADSCVAAADFDVDAIIDQLTPC
jgi:predicted GH43/DUF377 family glycosyl hydrolase/glycosyltransferase involved in cell wall biosynthesis